MALGNIACGSYKIYVAYRGGSPLVSELKGTSAISFNRALNTYSEANITLAMDAKCVNALSTVNPWEHEIHVYRSGQLVWCGPIMSIEYLSAESKVKIYARDLWAWTAKRFIEVYGEDYEVEEVDAAEVFNWILSHGYSKQPWNMTWSISATGIPITKFYPAFQDPDRWGGSYPICEQELSDIASYGLDFTVLGREMYGGSLVVNPPRNINLKIGDQNWLKAPDIKVNGAQMSTRTAVAGGTGGYYGYYDEQLWIQTDVDSPYGLLETFTSKLDLDEEETTEHPNAITQEALGRHLILNRPIALIRGGQLAGNAPFDFNDIIPGVPIHVGLLNSIRKLETDYRLAALDVSVDATSETVNMVLTAPGVSDVVGD